MRKRSQHQKMQTTNRFLFLLFRLVLTDEGYCNSRYDKDQVHHDELGQLSVISVIGVDKGLEQMHAGHADQSHAQFDLQCRGIDVVEPGQFAACL